MIRKLQIVGDLKKCPELINELDKCILLCANCHHRLEYCDDCRRKKIVVGEKISVTS